ncbi:MAG: autotransporter outer membrane beta-barrel domain-containing protein [Puniceicoccales bacterium]|jgi:outer membrane autotransporter protein|nr:autotransporter outer membrane beta-barrel domain-containing protein [Puniceicoccales bacterium]
MKSLSRFPSPNRRHTGATLGLLLAAAALPIPAASGAVYTYTWGSGTLAAAGVPPVNLENETVIIDVTDGSAPGLPADPNLNDAFDALGSIKTVRKQGVHALLLSKFNNYGNVFIENGTLQIDIDNNLNATGTNMIGSGATLEFTGAVSTEFKKDWLLNGTASVSVGSGKEIVFSGKFTGTGSLEKTGAGTLILSNANDYQGSTIISDGKLIANHVDASNVIDTFGKAQFAGNVPEINLQNGATLGIAVNGTLKNKVTGNGDVHIHTGSQSLVVVLDNDNTFTGTITVSGTSILEVRKDANLGNATNGLIFNGGAIIINNGNEATEADNYHHRRNWTIQGGTDTKLGAAVIVPNGTKIFMDGDISGDGVLDLHASSGGSPDTRITFTGNNIAHTGHLTVHANLELSIAGDANVGTGNLTLDGGTLLLKDENNAGTPLSYTNNWMVTNAGGIFKIEENDSVTFGPITPNKDKYGAEITDDGGITKTGKGELTLSAANTYTGKTQINEGKLIIGSTGTLGENKTTHHDYAGAIQIAQDTSLVFEQADATAQTLSGAINGSGILEKKNTSNTLTLTNTASIGNFHGTLKITGGTVLIDDTANTDDTHTAEHWTLNAKLNDDTTNPNDSGARLVINAKNTFSLGANTDGGAGISDETEADAARFQGTVELQGGTWLVNNATPRLALSQATVELNGGVLALDFTNNRETPVQTLVVKDITIGGTTIKLANFPANVSSLPTNPGILDVYANENLTVTELLTDGASTTIIPNAVLLVEVTASSLASTSQQLGLAINDATATTNVVFSDDETQRENTREIIYGGNVKAAYGYIAVYGVKDTPTDDDPAKQTTGIYLSYGLKSLDVTSGTLTLNSSSSAKFPATMDIPINGDGNLTVNIGVNSDGDNNTLTFTRENGIQGTVTLSSGTLVAGADKIFESANYVSVTGGIFDAKDTEQAFKRYNLNANAEHTLGTTGILTLTDTKSTNSINGILTGAKVIEKDSVDRETKLTYTGGGTFINNGTLTGSGSYHVKTFVNEGTATTNGIIAGGMVRETNPAQNVQTKLQYTAADKLTNNGTLTANTLYVKELENNGTLTLNGVLAGGFTRTTDPATKVSKDTYDTSGKLINRAGASATVNNIHGNVENHGNIYFNSANYYEPARITWDGNLSGDGTLHLTVDLLDPTQSDKLTITGNITGEHTVQFTDITLNPDTLTRDSGRNIVVIEAKNNHGGGTFTGSVDSGAYRFYLTPGGNGTYAFGRTAYSTLGKNIFNTAGAMSMGWFSQLDSLHKRFGELRVALSKRAAIPPEYYAAYNNHAKADATAGAAVPPPAPEPAAGTGAQAGTPGLNNGFWLRGHAQQVDVDLKIQDLGKFTEYQYGFDAGYDHAVSLGQFGQLYLGGFVGFLHATRNLEEESNSKGSTDSPAFGLYATWYHEKGWYADGTLKGQYFTSSYDAGNYHGEFDNYAFGFSLEFGRRVNLRANWFVEPSAQLAYTHVFSETYTAQSTGTASDVRVLTGDSDIFRYGVGLRVGKTLDTGDNGLIQPYAKAGIEKQSSLGGSIRIPGEDKLTPNTDGTRATLGFGIAWQLDPEQQVHLDYECAFGSKYTRPWSLNLAYRLRF